eukprot:PITA_15791
MNSICLVLCLVASFKWEVHQRDVKSTSLHEEIYMEQPHGFIQTDSSLVCRLKKYLYGLKQAPCAWYAKMDSFILDTGFSRCHSNNTIYTKKVEAYCRLCLHSWFWTYYVGLQKAIFVSSTEAEYHGAIEASKEALWLRRILSEFGFQQQHSITFCCDNQSAIQLCKDLVQHQHIKHIELHMHFIRKLIQDHVLKVQYCSIDDQVANIFTKALIEAKFTKI